MLTGHLDFETRSELDLRKVGLHNYANHPSTDVWCMAWALGDAEPAIWTPGMEPPAALVDHVRAGGRMMSHDAPFELTIWNVILVQRYGFLALLPEQTYCTMAMGYAMGLPGALEDQALVLGLPFQKDMEGRALMLRYARPWRKAAGGVSARWMDKCPRFTVGGKKYDGASGLLVLHEYCKQDVRVERALEERLMPLSDYERRVWLMDYAINQRGVKIDVETARAGVAYAERLAAASDEAMAKLTGGAVQTIGALMALKQWLREQGFPYESLDKVSVDEAVLKLKASHNPNAERVLQALILRQEASQTSTAKLYTMLAQMGADERVRNMFQYHGTGPGRWSGRGPQPHNFPREVPEYMEFAMHLFRERQTDYINVAFGPPLSILSRCLRGFLVAKEGRVFVGADFSAVEGRGTAWLFGENWKLKMFRDADAGIGPGAYEHTAAKILNLPIVGSKVSGLTKAQRQAYGKVPELALGFAGGVGAFQKMAKAAGVHIPDDQADAIKRAWRDAHPMTKRGWRDLQKAAITAVANPGHTITAEILVPIKYRVVGPFLWCLLPSGRTICYPFPKLMEGAYGPQLTYMTVPGPDQARIFDKMNSGNWARVATHGGPLTQNIVSGMCRDLLVHAMLQLHEEKFPIVLHVHDDVNAEVPERIAEPARKRMEEIMNSPPAWAAGFPLFAKAVVTGRYGAA